MPKIDIESYVDNELAPRSARKKRIGPGGPAPKGREKRARYLRDLVDIAEKIPVDIHQNFSPTFSSSGHERYWILTYLESFYNGQVISDVLSKVKGGKEANVYCCSAYPSTGLSLIAAKIYRPRMLRNLRNDARYRQGRVVRPRREAVAVLKNTRYGQELRHNSWLGAEYETLQILHQAGADVPRPVAMSENVILMEYVGEANLPAPTLNQVSLTRKEAQGLFDRLVENLAIMLAHHRVHADLSAYNILYWEGRFTIIDFPQAVDPRRNTDSAELFTRDVVRVCQYFNRYGFHHNPYQLASDLWSQFQRSNALDASIVNALPPPDEDEE